MPLEYEIMPELKLAYVKASGKLTVNDIMIKGAGLFAEGKWENGFNVLCDYREVVKVDLNSQDVREIVSQDKTNESLFDKSKCGIVADKDCVFGLSRMWEIHTENANNKIETMVFRNIEDSLRWFGMEVSVLQVIKNKLSRSPSLYNREGN
ncbi:MAG: hypothetical protein ACYTFY_02680 [Planctomycetota bacterium]|jgi:hypothetical protein